MKYYNFQADAVKLCENINIKNNGDAWRHVGSIPIISTNRRKNKMTKLWVNDVEHDFVEREDSESVDFFKIV
jgi:hypothetical protein